MYVFGPECLHISAKLCTLPLMQKPVRLNEDTYLLVESEAARTKTSIAKTANRLIIRGLELGDDSDSDVEPAKQPESAKPISNPNIAALRRTMEMIPATPTTPDAGEELQNWAVYVGATGVIIRDRLTQAEAEDFLNKHNVDGDLSIGVKG